MKRLKDTVEKSVTLTMGLCLLVTIVLLWLWYLETQNQLTQTQTDAAFHEAVSLRLDNAVTSYPGRFVTDPDAWRRYQDNAEKLWQLASSGHSEITVRHLSPPPKSAISGDGIINKVVAIQAEITNLQTELMGLRGLRDSITYRIDGIRTSVDLILGTLFTSSVAPPQTIAVMQLKSDLLTIEKTVHRFWLPDANRNTATELLSTSLTRALETAQNLIDGEHALVRAGSRREMLSVIKHLTQFKDQSEGFKQAIEILDQIEKNQQRITVLVSDRDNHGNSAASSRPQPGWRLLAMPLLIIAAWIAPCLSVLRKSISLAIPTTQRINSVAVLRNEEQAPEPDLSTLLLAMEQLSKGNLGYRMDDRRAEIRDIATSFNQMASALYRAVIEVCRAASALQSQMLPGTNPEATEQRSEPHQSAAPLDHAINSTLELAGIVDQLTARQCQDATHKIQNGEHLVSIIARLDKHQAIIRAIIRDHINSLSNSMAPKNDDSLSVTREAITALHERLKFFKLEKKR